MPRSPWPRHWWHVTSLLITRRKAIAPEMQKGNIECVWDVWAVKLLCSGPEGPSVSDQSQILCVLLHCFPKPGTHTHQPPDGHGRFLNPCSGDWITEMHVCRDTGKEDKAEEDWSSKLCLWSEVYKRDSVSRCVLQPVDGWSEFRPFTAHFHKRDGLWLRRAARSTKQSCVMSGFIKQRASSLFCIWTSLSVSRALTNQLQPKKVVVKK